MRIALTNPEVELGGGVERVVVEIANGLSRLGEEVTVCAARIAPGVLDPGVQVRVVPVPARVDAHFGVGFRGRCARALRAVAPDAHGAFSVLSPLGGLFWVPSVHRVGYDFLLSRRGAVAQSLMRAHPYHRVRLRLEDSMFSPGATAGLLAQTEAVAADIRRCYPRSPKVGVLPLGYDAGSFNPQMRTARRERVRRSLGFSEEDRVLLFIANELERKGFDLALRALERVGEARLLGAGRVNPTRQQLRSGVGERVRWVGHTEEVADLYAAADALLLPTRYEPWGLVIIEALGCGLPVVTTRLAGAASAVVDGETGVLLDDPEDIDRLADAVRWALSDRPADSGRLAASVRSLAWEQIVGRYHELLTQTRAR